MDSQIGENINFDNDPHELCPIIDKETRTLFYSDGYVKIGNDVVSKQDWAYAAESIWDCCAFRRSKSHTFDYNDHFTLNNREVRKRVVVKSGLVESNLKGKIKHYRKVNGKYKKRRADMLLGVAGTQFYGDCQPTSGTWWAWKGYKKRKTRKVKSTQWLLWQESIVCRDDERWWTMRSGLYFYVDNDDYQFLLFLYKYLGSVMNKITINMRGGLCSLLIAFKWMVWLVTTCCPITFITAQDYIGIGLHLTPPIRFDITNTTLLKIRPLPGVGGSLTYRKELGRRKRSVWHVEAGLTFQGLRYYQLNYINDSTTIWSDYINNHTGFPSLLAGVGRSWNFGRNDNNQISAGGELLFLITQDLDEIGSYNFGIINHPINDAVGPFFLRLNLGYSKNFSLFHLIPARLQIYTALGLQNITRGTQYVPDPETGRIVEGRYYVNNSELGIKLYSSLNWRGYQKTSKTVSVDNAVLAQEARQRRFRISVNGQFCRVPTTVYHIPQVDSFSVSGRPIMLPQLSVVVEIPHKRNDLWSTVLGMGVGHRDATLQFCAASDFPSHNQPVQSEQSLAVGHYVILNVGLARRHSLKGKVISHSFTASAVAPIEQESLYFGVPLTNLSQTPPPFTDAILEGTIIQDNYQERVLFGIEYNPELILNLPGPLFMGLGLVANYSFGGVIAGGEFKVSNDYTTYYGAVLQSFGKLGISMRVGFEK